ncbi:MAG: hypothetical protein IAE81_11500 [Caldilineaceae bacterium]|jgi:hypothetical protein|nr:hypothetical protein [Caldilineaceae bacterium]
MAYRQGRRFLILAVAALVLAAWTGVLMRFGMVYGFPAWAQNFGAIRHAHSHLMYFGWVTLALMALIWADLPRHTGRALPRGVSLQMALTAGMAFLSFPAFWANGYGLTTIGAARLPLGSMVSTLNGLTWFYFVGLYVFTTRRLPLRSLAVQLWDWALALLLLASLGAVGLVGMVFTRAEHPFLQQLFLHQFLDLFAVGWFGLALLGLLWSHVDATGATPRGWLPTFSLALLVAPTFLLGVSPAVLPASLFWVAAVANAGAAVLLSVHGVQLWRHRREFPQLLWLASAGLASVIAVAVFLLWPGVWQQSAGGQLRIFYLHVFLLMWVSTALLGLLEARLLSTSAVVRWINALWVGGVLVMVGGLLGLGLAPMLDWPQLLWLHVSAWGSLFVALSATLLLAALLLRSEATVSRQ